MTTIARIKKDGSLLLKNEINERLPVITDGLVAYYPLDSQAGGVDVIGGNGTVQNLESGVNILDAMKDGGWRNPANWSISATWDETKQALRIEGGQNGFLNIPVIIDPAKHYEIQMTVFIETAGNNLLYLGGAGYDINGTWVTTNWMYFLAVGHDYPSLTGVWTTFRITLAGTGALPYLNSYAYSAYLSEAGGWSENGRTTYKYHYGGLFNYNGGGVMYIKDCSVRTVDPNTSNAIITEDGVAIQEVTTNLLNYTCEFDSWGFSTNSGSVPTVTPNCTSSPRGYMNADKIYIPNDGTYPRIYQNFTPSSTAEHTFSIWLKTIGSSVQTVLFIFRNSPWGFSNGTTVTITNVWQRFTVTFTPLDTSVHEIYIGSHDATKGVTYFLWGAQIEQNSFATAFINGSNGQGNLTIPTIGLIGLSGSVSFKFSIEKFVNSYTHIIDNGYNGGWFFLGCSVTTNYLYMHEPATSASSSTSITPSLNIWYTAILTWDNNTQYLYIDGILRCSVATTGQSHIDRIPYLRLGYPNNGVQDVKYKDLSIYNKTLSVSEIKELSGEGFKLATSRVTTPLLIESPVIPLDAYYFPLASDTKDSSKTIDATQNTNVAFENSSDWVGTSTTNIYTSIPFNNIYNNYGVPASKVTLVNETYNNQIIERVSMTPDANVINDFRNSLSSHGVCGNYMTFLANIPYCVSVFWRPISHQDTYVGLTASNIGGWSDLYTIDYPGSWKRTVTTRLSGSNASDQMFFSFRCPSLNAGDTHIMDWSGPQLEQGRNFETPFVNGTRGTSSLEYNFNSSIGLDWSGNWTICYWKKPVATNDDTLTGYNIETLGCNGNSVGGDLLYWGKDYGADTIITAPPYSFTSSDYFNNWSFVSIVSFGGIITIKTQLSTGIVYVRTLGTPGTSNAYVTQYGYDFKMGGWDNGNPTNTYFRDLIVLKRALSDTELNNIYKQFSINKTSIYTENLIEEGL